MLTYSTSLGLVANSTKFIDPNLKVVKLSRFVTCTTKLAQIRYAPIYFTKKKVHTLGIS